MEKRRDILDSKGLEIRLVGIILGLISLIGLLNLGPIGNFIYFCLGYCLGIFAYVPLIIVLVVSLSLIIRKCSLKKSNPFFIAGIIVFRVGLAISCSNSKSLNMSTLKTNFEYAYNTADISLFNIPSFISLTSLKGGIIGYFFAALFNTALTYIGTIVLYSVLLFVGVVLMLFYPIRYIVENIETKIYQKKGLKSEILHINKPQFVEEVVEQKELYREKEDSLDQEDNVTFIPYGKTYQSPGVVPTKVKFHNEDNKDSVTSSDKKDDDRPILSIEEYKDNRSNITIQIENRDDFLCDNIIKNEDANEDSNNFIADENIQDIALSESFKQFVDKTFSHQAPTPIVKGEEAIIDEFEPVSASLLNDYEDENVLQQNEQSCFEREKIINCGFWCWSANSGPCHWTICY